MLRTTLSILAMFNPAPLPVSHTEAPISIQIVKPIAQIKQVDPEPMKPMELAPYHFDPPGTHANPYPVGQCTWLAASMKGNVPVWGNAENWDDAARAAGIPVSDVPVVGALGIERIGNHVVVVTAVNPDGTVTVEEGNYDYNGSIRSYVYPISKFDYILM